VTLYAGLMMLIRPLTNGPADAAGGLQRMVRRSALLLAVVVLAAACGGGDAESGSTAASPPSRPAGPAAPGEPPAGVLPDGRPRSPLTGLPTDAEVLAQPVVIAKIENSPASRPQSGLDAADVVIEELVEFGITRFLALFLGELPAVAGPIRSARPVDVDLLGTFGASGFAYSGARPEVLSLLASSPAVLVTEGADGFFRDDGRNAPHNLYIRPADVLSVVTARGGRPLVDLGWTFADEPPTGATVCPPAVSGCTDPGLSVVVEMSSGYRSGWTYDARAGVYRRDQNGRSFDVTGGGAIGAANVVILATRHYVGASGYDETDATTAGAPAIVLRDGLRFDVEWVKPTARDQLVLRTADGRPFPLKPGATWFHLPAAGRMPAVG
jgi:hypothetical protein